MSERKVLNKYYPPDFDASKIPRVKREKNRQFVIRLMAPFNMRCTTCGEYIYRGKKFNARKEDVIGKTYIGIQIYRFYIKCTKCLAEITFLTDPENQDYAMENGAIRNFESVRLAAIQAEQEAKQKKEEEVNNPMKILENRTRDSRREMAVIETLEDLRELNAAHANVDPKVLLQAEDEYKMQLERLQQEEDEEEIRRIFGKKSSDGSNPYGYLSDILVQDDEPDEKPVVKKEKLKDDEDAKSAAKKVKTEPSETAEAAPAVKATGLSAFLQKKLPTANPSKSEADSKSKQFKSNVGLFIKKKADAAEVKTEPAQQSEPPKQPSTSAATATTSVQPNALAGLMNAYDDDSDSDSS